MRSFSSLIDEILLIETTPALELLLDEPELNDRSDGTLECLFRFLLGPALLSLLLLLLELALLSLSLDS